MKPEEAIEIVLSLARENVTTDFELGDEAQRQREAINTAEDFFTNNVFDGTDPHVDDVPDDYWGEDPEFPLEDWRHEVMENNTRRGYWE